MTNRKQPRENVPIQKLGNGVTLGHIAYTKSWGPLFGRPQPRFGRVVKITAGIPLKHNVQLERIDNGSDWFDYGMHLAPLTEAAYLEHKEQLKAQLEQLEQAWKLQQQLDNSETKTLGIFS